MIYNDIEPEEIGIDKSTYDIIQEVDMEWDLYLVNKYKPEQLRRLDLSLVNLPKEWFAEWLKRLT